jgi:hypothetical protein
MPGDASTTTTGTALPVIALAAGVIYISALHQFHLSPLAEELLAVSGAFALRSFVKWRGWVVPIPPSLAGRRRRPG